MEEVPESFPPAYCSQFPPEKHASGDHFVVEDLLDFSNEDAVANDSPFDESSVAGNNSTESSTVTVVDSCNSLSAASEPNFGADAQFAGDLSVPYDDLAELDQWLSNFVEESFSSEDLQKLQLISGLKARQKLSSEARKFESGQIEITKNNSIFDVEDNSNGNPIFDPDISVPGKARSKRSRAAPGNWASRLLLLSKTTSSPEPDVLIPNPNPQFTPPTAGKKPGKPPGWKKKEASGDGNSPNNEGRKCLHCATDKTPQWRTGPMGPKTLCNACGVRYKSGRLVPEYRPASSPTFMLTKHSNSHRKVMELRRQKEIVRGPQPPQQQFLHQHHQGMVFDVSNGDDYLIHQNVGPDFRQMI